MDLAVLYNDFMTPEEKEFEISFARESMEFEKLDLAYRCIVEKENLDILDAELRCMEENGDMDLLEDYYREAEEQSGGEEKKEGILTKMIDFIRRQFEKIKNFLFGSDKKKSLEELAKEGKDVGIDDQANKTLSTFGKIKQVIGNGVKGFLNWFMKESANGEKKIDIIKVLGVALAGGGVALGVAKHKVAAQKIKELVDTFDNFINDGIEKAKGGVSLIASIIGDKAKNAKEIALKALNTFTGWVKRAVNWLLGLVGLGKKHDDSALEDKSGKTLGIEDKKKREKEDARKEKRKEKTIKESLLRLEDENDEEKLRNFVKKHLNRTSIKSKKIDSLSVGKLKKAAKEIIEGNINYESANDFDYIFGDLFEESSDDVTIDDLFDFSLPDEFVEESTGILDEIDDLLSSL